MNLREALFLSSLSKARYEQGIASASPSGGYRSYRVEVEITQEEYMPLIGLGPLTGDRFNITVCRVEGETVYPPHVICKEYSLEKCIEFLQAWGVGEEYENPWHPVEEWSSEQEEGAK